MKIAFGDGLASCSTSKIDSEVLQLALEDEDLHRLTSASLRFMMVQSG